MPDGPGPFFFSESAAVSSRARTTSKASGKPPAGADVPTPRRGRAPAKVYDVEEVADLLGVTQGWVERALAKDVEGFLPGAFRERDGSWRVPARALRHVLGEGMPRLLPVAEFAALVGLSVPWIYELMDLGIVASRRVLGQRRIPATAYWELPEHRPASLPARPLFFGSEKGGEPQ